MPSLLLPPPPPPPRLHRFPTTATVSCVEIGAGDEIRRTHRSPPPRSLLSLHLSLSKQPFHLPPAPGGSDEVGFEDDLFRVYVDVEWCRSGGDPEMATAAGRSGDGGGCGKEPAASPIETQTLAKEDVFPGEITVEVADDVLAIAPLLPPTAMQSPSLKSDGWGGRDIWAVHPSFPSSSIPIERLADSVADRRDDTRSARGSRDGCRRRREEDDNADSRGIRLREEDLPSLATARMIVVFLLSSTATATATTTATVLA